MRLHPYVCGPQWKRPDNAGPHAEDLGHSKRMTDFVVCDADGKGINYMQIRGDNNEARRIICLLSAVSQLHRPLPSRTTQCSFNRCLPPSPFFPPPPSSLLYHLQCIGAYSASIPPPSSHVLSEPYSSLFFKDI